MNEESNTVITLTNEECESAILAISKRVMFLKQHDTEMSADVKENEIRTLKNINAKLLA